MAASKTHRVGSSAKFSRHAPPPPRRAKAAGRRATETIDPPSGGHASSDPVPDQAMLFEWTNMAKAVLERAALQGDQEQFDLARDFLGSVLQVSELFHAFQKSPGGRVTGPRGVAKHMNLSRPAVYLRLDMVGLTAECFREPGVTIANLVTQSDKIGLLLRQVEKRYEELPSAANNAGALGAGV